MVMFINILSGEIAEKTYTSKATVIRFAKAMGYDGWKEFMKDYIAEIQYRKNFENKIDYNFPFQAGDNLNTILDRMHQLQIETIRETRGLLQNDVLKQAANRIVNAKNVD